jgi:formylglycine-generating enzyme required for sulfatase activity
MKKILYLLLIGLLALTACDEKDEPESAIETINVNGVSFNMVKVKGGSLKMNMEFLVFEHFLYYQDSTLNVTVRDFSIGQTEVTQALWLAVMGENPSYFSSNNDEWVFEDDFNRPVEWVSWDDCQNFISKLNELTGRHFRLPTEAEWEFAARGGNKTHGYPYAGSNNIDEVAWWIENCDGMTHPVGQKKPNELGLYDMSGNVREWCSSRESVIWYTNNAIIYRIIRGGAYIKNSDRCTVWHRDGEGYMSTVHSSTLGLRLAE